MRVDHPGRTAAPGAQLRSTNVDCNRLTSFIATTTGQLADHLAALASDISLAHRNLARICRVNPNEIMRTSAARL